MGGERKVDGMRGLGFGVEQSAVKVEDNTTDEGEGGKGNGCI